MRGDRSHRSTLHPLARATRASVAIGAHVGCDTRLACPSGVDSPRFPAALALKPAGQSTRIVYVIRDFAGLECDALSV